MFCIDCRQKIGTLLTGAVQHFEKYTYLLFSSKLDENLDTSFTYKSGINLLISRKQISAFTLSKKEGISYDSGVNYG